MIARHVSRKTLISFGLVPAGQHWLAALAAAATVLSNAMIARSARASRWCNW
jgi:hypothetical protein